MATKKELPLNSFIIRVNFYLSTTTLERRRITSTHQHQKAKSSVRTSAFLCADHNQSP